MSYGVSESKDSILTQYTVFKIFRPFNYNQDIFLFVITMNLKYCKVYASFLLHLTNHDFRSNKICLHLPQPRRSKDSCSNLSNSAPTLSRNDTSLGETIFGISAPFVLS